MRWSLYITVESRPMTRLRLRTPPHLQIEKFRRCGLLFIFCPSGVLTASILLTVSPLSSNNFLMAAYAARFAIIVHGCCNFFLRAGVAMKCWVLSERELTFTFAVARPSVCRPSVTFVHRSQTAEIFGNVSILLGTLAVRWNPRKILRRSSQGNPSIGRRGVSAKGVAKSLIAILDLSKAISRKRRRRCKQGSRIRIPYVFYFLKDTHVR